MSTTSTRTLRDLHGSLDGHERVEFFRRLRTEREGGRSAADLADELAVSRSTVYQLLRTASYHEIEIDRATDEARQGIEHLERFAKAALKAGVKLPYTVTVDGEYEKIDVRVEKSTEHDEEEGELQYVDVVVDGVVTLDFDPAAPSDVKILTGRSRL